MPTDGSIEAEFNDGYILSETELNDISPYDPNHNILRHILNKWSESEHGPMVRLSCFYKDQRYDINWTILPPDARPIRFKHYERDHNLSGEIISEQRLMGVDFGYQYTDIDGKNVQQVSRL